MTELPEGWSPNGDLAGLFSPDGAIDERVARVLAEQLAAEPQDPLAQDRDAARLVPGFEVSSIEGLVPVPPEEAFPGATGVLAALKTGLNRADIEPALNEVVGESAPVAGPVPHPGDGGYYFLRGVDSAESAAPPAADSAAFQETAAAPPETFDVQAVRGDFPILAQRVHGHPLIWLDNAATTQKPQSVIDRVAAYYTNDNSNVHRAAHTLAARATEGYEGARETVRRFLGASSPEEIIFVHGTTEAINLVAQTLGRTQLGPGDEILLTTLEHHSNIVPWQLVAAETGAVLREAPISDSGEILLEEYGRLLGPRTKVVGLSHVSNALGTILPVREMVEMAHRADATVVVDGAQAVAHFPVDVQTLGADFYAFSGHKLFGPTGIGVLYGKEELLEEMQPWQGGGSMIDDVTFERTTYAAPPQKFEAGTPIIAGAIGLGAAIEYVERLGLDNVARYERTLTEYTTAALDTVPGLTQIGTATEKVGVFSFVMDGIPVEQLGRHLDQYGIAVRAGHHCAQPTVRRFGLEGTVRPSLALYNTAEEVDCLVDALRRVSSLPR